MPTIHDKAEARMGPPHFEGYRFAGGSPDGKRVAFIATHIGPGSGQPVGGVHVAEVGTAQTSQEILNLSYFNIRGGEAELPMVEQEILNDYAEQIGATGVVVGKNLPTPQPWCSDVSGRIFLASGAELKLDVTRSTCEKDPRNKTLTWRVCAKNGGGCVGTAPQDCIDGAVTVRNIYRLGKIDWVVVDILMQPFTGIDFHHFEITGGSLNGS